MNGLIVALGLRRVARRYPWLGSAADAFAKWALITFVPVCLVGIIVGYAVR